MSESAAHVRAVRTGRLDRLQVAQLIAATLAQLPDVTAVCLYGSVARGDATEDSDLDLLVVADSGRVSNRQLRDMVPDAFKWARPAPVLYTVAEFDLLLASGASFLAHVLREGRILFDRHGAMRSAFAAQAQTPLDLEPELTFQLGRLHSFEDTSQFNGEFLFCLAHLYAIGKAIVMIVLEKRGRPEYNKDRAFRALARRYPQLRHDIQRVAELKPFYLQVARGREARFPFSHRHAGDKVPAVISAIRNIATAS